MPLVRAHDRSRGLPSAPAAPGLRGFQGQREEVRAAGVLGAARPLYRIEREVWIDLTLEALEKGGARRRGVTRRVTDSRVKAMGG